MKIKTNVHRAGGMAINWITIFVQILVSLFFVPFFLKTVGDKQYGLYAFSNSLIAWIDTLLIAIAAAYHKFLTRSWSLCSSRQRGCPQRRCSVSRLPW